MIITYSRQVVKKLIGYFPTRLILCATFFSYIIISNLPQIQASEEQVLLSMLHFVQVPSYMYTNFYIGTPYAPVIFHPPVHIQFLFITFFLSLGVASLTNSAIRMKIFIYSGLCFASFIASEFLIILLLFGLNVVSDTAFLYGSIIVTSLIGVLLIESCIFKSITTPQKNKIKPTIKRTYLDEYVYFAAMLVSSSLLMYTIVTVLQIDPNSLTFSYLALNIAAIFSFTHFLSYFLMETRIPFWAKGYKQIMQHQKQQNLAVSFLLPAYNEEKTIKRCIESIDKAAANYSGQTEIIVVNDGSSDGTRNISSDAIVNLKNASGKVFNIPNSGKGFALKYGLKHVTGDIIFRIDADSVLDKASISSIVNHFRDPLVGSVSGVILTLEEKSIWQKIGLIQLLFIFLFYRREEELTDSIMVQSGAFSVFRKDALIKVGGWMDNRYGEDGEITIRLGRYGYKNEFEPRASLRTDHPFDFHALREQRVRWNLGYYHSRSANFDIMREFKGPRTLMYMYSMYAHGIDFVYAVSLPFFILGFLIEYYNFGVPLQILYADLYRIIIIDLLMFGLQHILYLCYVCKFKRFDLIKYIPLMRLFTIVNLWFFKTEALEILLTWSSKWKLYNKDAYKALKGTVKQSLRT